MPRKSEMVIALDPGERTGWAVGRMSLDRLELLESGVLRWDLMEKKLANDQHIIGPNGGDLGPRTYDVIVAESWRPRRINGRMDWIEGDELTPAKHVGGIRFISRWSGARYVEQKPSDKPSIRASYPLPLAEVDEGSNEQHDQDARLHLWGYFFTNWYSVSVDTKDTIWLPS